jgi:UTP-glucose-1-phosphate uridylyltransferase
MVTDHFTFEALLNNRLQKKNKQKKQKAPKRMTDYLDQGTIDSNGNT